MAYKQEFQRWLDLVQDETLKVELESLNDEKEIEDRFYKNLEFGTGGLRGKIAAGTNRMNIYTVAKATQGLATYLTGEMEAPSVAIAYDSRNMSREFAETSASVLAANGVKVYLYESLRPTPMLSFAVRHLGTDSGIVVTASHNPKEYNGYKVYGNDGGQLTDNAANKVLGFINETDIFADVKTMSLEDAQAKGLLVYIGKDVDEAYYTQVETLCVRKELVKSNAKDLNIIFTPIHGSGNIPVRDMLARLGFENVTVVKEQELPDGNFPTAPYPNPEARQVFELAIDLAGKQDTDLIFGTDPDCDRIGVVVKEDNGNYRVLSGNQVGVLLTDYLLGARKSEGVLESKDAIIKTIVTSDMGKAICAHYGVEMMEVLTGFKYIGEKIKEFRETGSNNFVLGFEESYGYLAGEFVRDKDAVIASVLIAEMALYYKTQGKNLYEALEGLYEQFGYYQEELTSITMEGKDGQEAIAKIITALRDNKPSQVGEFKIAKVEDYKVGRSYDLATGEESVINLPSSNVMKFILADGGWFVVRPSGTEPKMKVYFMLSRDSKEATREAVEALQKEVLALVDSLK